MPFKMQEYEFIQSKYREYLLLAIEYFIKSDMFYVISTVKSVNMKKNAYMDFEGLVCFIPNLIVVVSLDSKALFSCRLPKSQ
jgi:hypothetical protein